MSKIIKKEELDLVIENVLKENGITIVEAEAKPDFADIDKDGDKEETMKKAAKDKEEKEDMKEEEMCEGEGCEDVMDESEDDIVDESADELAEAVKSTTDNKLLKEDMANFKRLINHKF